MDGLVGDTLGVAVDLWRHNRNVFYLLLGSYVFSCAVQAMPKPNGVHGSLYYWVYGTLHGIAGNWRLILKVLRERKFGPDNPATDQSFAVGFECIACGVVMADSITIKAGAGPWHRHFTKCSECAVASAAEKPQ